MAFDELLADRMRQNLASKKVMFEEKKMMGGLAIMVDSKMCFGINKDNFMARIGPDAYEDALKKEGCRPMDFTGRPMKGFVFVDASAVDMDEDLDYWINLCLAYNPLAKASKKRKKKKK